MIMADKIATREAYGAALAEFGDKYDFVVIDADIGAATKPGMFKKKFPDRFLDCGIAEGNMISVAAGIATTGMNVFASSFAMFAAGRAFEQIRNSIGYPHLNVKIGATHAGITVGEDGATHQCLEDIALMRTIPGMVVINPADAVEARAVVEWALNYKGPAYIRFGRAAVPVIFDKETYKFELGKNRRLREGKDVTIYASGFTVGIALEAAELLAAEGISARVVNVASIKPLDTDEVAASAAETGAFVPVEEHNVIGGLGEAIASAAAETRPVPVIRVGTQDVFGKSGKVPALLEAYGLTAANVAEKAKKAIAMKG